MDELSHSNESAPEQVQQLISCSPHNTNNANQTASDQPGCSQTGNSAQTLSEQLEYSLHTESNTLTVYELSDLSSHPAEPESLYCEINEEDAIRTAPVTEECPVQLPICVKSNRLR
jgi:hypothetical protein